MPAPTTLFVSEKLQSMVSVDRVWSRYRGLTCAPCLAFLRTSPSPYRAGIPGQLVPVGSDRASRRRVVSRGWAYPRSESAGSELEAVLLARPSGRRGHPEAGWRLKRALLSERWAGVEKWALFLLGQAF